MERGIITKKRVFRRARLFLTPFFLSIFLLASLLLVSSEDVVPAMPHIFYGTANLNSNPAPTGTIVEAYIDSAPAGSTTTEAGGSYTLVVTGAVGDMVNFKICSLTAGTGTFSEEGGETNLDLSATGSCTATDTGNGDGGGGGSVALPTSNLTTSNKESHFYDAINASGKAIFAIANNTKLAFTNIEFNANANQTVNNARITISVLNSMPSYISSLKNVYQYLLVETENLDNHVENIEISFRVLKSWLSNNNYDKANVALIRYYDGWTTLKTNLVSEDDEYVYYKAQSPAFSIFAIKVLEIVEKPALPGGDNATPPMPPPLPAEQDQGGAKDATGGRTQINAKAPILTGIVLFIIVILIIILIIARFKSKKKQKINEEKTRIDDLTRIDDFEKRV
jgi:PGF-pre-PGF domain-containing protein